MAKFELSIYGDNDEVVKKYETNIVRWKVSLEALKLREEIKEKKKDVRDLEYVLMINEILKKAFKGLTDEELGEANQDDVINTFFQISNSGGKIGGSKNV